MYIFVQSSNPAGLQKSQSSTKLRIIKISARGDRSQDTRHMCHCWVIAPDRREGCGGSGCWPLVCRSTIKLCGSEARRGREGRGRLLVREVGELHLHAHVPDGEGDAVRDQEVGCQLAEHLVVVGLTRARAGGGGAARGLACSRRVQARAGSRALCSASIGGRGESMWAPARSKP